MWTPVRAWWYQHFAKSEAWPPDVRELIIRSALKTLKGSKLAPKEQEELAKRLLVGALSEEYEDLSSELRADLLVEGMGRLGQLPTENCAGCGTPVFTHEALRVDGKFYCASCGSNRTGPASK